MFFKKYPKGIKTPNYDVAPVPNNPTPETTYEEAIEELGRKISVDTTSPFSTPDLSIINEEDWFVIETLYGNTWLAKGVILGGDKKQVAFSYSSSTVYTNNNHKNSGFSIKSIRKATDKEVEDFYTLHPEYRGYFDLGHLMLDIETMGNTPYSAITAIGAVEFDPYTGETGRDFYVKVDLQNSVKEGLIMNPDTVLWWLKQSDQARKEMEGGCYLATALSAFSSFCKDKNYEVWANSPRFDCGILSDAYRILDKPVPWDFRKERCVRTIVAQTPSVEVKREGTAHNAKDDCLHQIKMITKAFEIIGK